MLLFLLRALRIIPLKSCLYSVHNYFTIKAISPPLVLPRHMDFHVSLEYGSLQFCMVTQTSPVSQLATMARFAHLSSVRDHSADYGGKVWPSEHGGVQVYDRVMMTASLRLGGKQP